MNKTVAILTVRHAGRMTPQGRADVVQWLRRQASMLARHAEQYAPRFTARYLSRGLLVAAALGLVAPALAQVQIGAPGAGLPRACHAGENLTVSTTAVGPTIATATGATVVVISHDGSANDVRFRMDDTAPTAAIGLRLTSTNHPIVIVGASLIGRLQFIREDAADAVIHLAFCK